MLGNDVVDPADPEARAGSVHPRFDARVFDAVETAALRRSGASGLRWVLWAAKEGAYKAARQLDRRTLFSPRRFAVRLVEAEPGRWRGRVQHGSGSYSAAVRVSDSRVHAVVIAADVPRPATDLIAVASRCAGDRPSQSVRQLARARLASWLGAEPSSLEFGRSGRAPCLQVDGERLPIALSFSHHGSQVGFAALRGIDRITAQA